MENKKKIIISILLIITLIGFIVYTIIENHGNNEINLEAVLSENLENDNTEQDSEEINIQNNIKGLDNNEIEENNNQIIVHVTGEVKKQGIVYLQEGARVADAIEKAGGETKEADLSQINLAYQLQDGQKIYVPNKNEKITEYITGGYGNNNENNNSIDNSNRKGEKSEYKYCKSK